MEARLDLVCQEYRARPERLAYQAHQSEPDQGPARLVLFGQLDPSGARCPVPEADFEIPNAEVLEVYRFALVPEDLDGLPHLLLIIGVEGPATDVADAEVGFAEQGKDLRSPLALEHLGGDDLPISPAHHVGEGQVVPEPLEDREEDRMVDRRRGG